jgi:hypothetical protein
LRIGGDRQRFGFARLVNAPSIEGRRGSTCRAALFPILETMSFHIGSPDGGMDVYDVLRENGFDRPAANPIVFAAPLLCDAQWEV